MRVSLLIQRNSYFKMLGGFIDEALGRGHTVNLFMDRSGIGSFVKGGASPSPESVPRFRRGCPNVILYDGNSALAESIKAESDVLVLHCGAISNYQSYLDKPDTWQHQVQKVRKASIPVVSLHSHFYDNCLLTPDAYDSVDLTCLLSQYSVEAHRAILLNCFNGVTAEDRLRFTESLDRAFREKTVVTGSALFDPFDEFYRKREGRFDQRDGAAVLFVPKIDQHPFMQVIMRRDFRWVSWLRSVLHYRGRYRHDIWQMPRYSEFLDSLSRLCAGAGLDIISKSRVKHGRDFERKLRRISVEYHSGADDEFYPDFTSLRILERARFCLHMRTFSVLEAVVAGVPSIHFEIPIVDSDDSVHPQTAAYVSTVRSSTAGGMFNFGGCVWSVPWSEALTFIDDLELKSVVQDPVRRKQYVERFCGVTGRSAAAREMDAVERLFV